MKSPIYTILLSKLDFSFALLLVTFELLEIEQSYIPFLKALMCGINIVGAQESGCMFTLCHAPLKMAVLLHKMASVCKQALMTVDQEKLFPELYCSGFAIFDISKPIVIFRNPLSFMLNSFFKGKG